MSIHHVTVCLFLMPNSNAAAAAVNHRGHALYTEVARKWCEGRTPGIHGVRHGWTHLGATFGPRASCPCRRLSLREDRCSEPGIWEAKVADLHRKNASLILIHNVLVYVACNISVCRCTLFMDMLISEIGFRAHTHTLIAHYTYLCDYIAL